MKVKIKDSQKIVDVYPISHKDGVRFAQVNNPSAVYSWNDLEPTVETQTDTISSYNVGLKVPISTSGTVTPVLQQNKVRPGPKS